MDASQVALPILGIVAAAAATFYAVSFAEMREKSFRELDESETETGGGFQSSASSRQRRARRKAEKEAKEFFIDDELNFNPEITRFETIDAALSTFTEFGPRDGYEFRPRHAQLELHRGVPRRERADHNICLRSRLSSTFVSASQSPFFPHDHHRITELSQSSQTPAMA